MNKAQDLKDRLAARKPIIGASVTFTDPCVTELMADIGFDFIWIDTEHSCLDKEKVLLHIMATRGTGAAAFVRVPWNEPVLVKPILEMGPDGVIFPFIRTAEDAERAVRSCRYPPEGIRGFGPIRALQYGIENREKYIAEADSRIFKLMQIEHVDAVRNLDEILKVEGVDCIVVGLNDLSGSIGLMNDTGHKEVKALTDAIIAKAAKAGKPFGVATGYIPALIKDWLARGACFIELAGDFRFLVKAAQDAYNGTRSLAGGL